MTPHNKTFYRELEENLPKVVAALKLLRKTTGKLGYGDIDPLSEKKWGQESWNAYMLLTAISDAIINGRTAMEFMDEFMSQFQPSEIQEAAKRIKQNDSLN